MALAGAGAGLTGFYLFYLFTAAVFPHHEACVHFFFPLSLSSDGVSNLFVYVYVCVNMSLYVLAFSFGERGKKENVNGIEMK